MIASGLSLPNANGLRTTKEMKKKTNKGGGGEEEEDDDTMITKTKQNQKSNV